MAQRHQAESARNVQPGAILLVIRKLLLPFPDIMCEKTDTVLFYPKRSKLLTYHLILDEFVARSPDELSLAKGDRIELIERDDDFGDGWFLGRHLRNGNTGLFPEGKET